MSNKISDKQEYSWLNGTEKEFFNNIKHDTLKLINKVEKLEQQIINLNAKYKNQINEIMLIFEDKKKVDAVFSDKPIWNALQNVETRVNAIEDAAILEQEQANQEVVVVTKWENDKKKTKNMTSCIGYRGEE